MSIILNRKDEILARLKREGLMQKLDSLESMQAREAINRHVVEVRRDYREKARLSIISASQLIIHEFIS